MGMVNISNVIYGKLNDPGDGTMSSLPGTSIARLRRNRGLSLSGLAEMSGVGKATLSALENGRGNPTVATLWAVAEALGVSFSQLLGEVPTKVEIGDGETAVRLIERTDQAPWIEVFSMKFAPGARRDAVAHSPGVRETVTVLKGDMIAGPSDRPSVLRTGDTLSFSGSCPHVYGALAAETTALVTVEYPAPKREDLGAGRAFRLHAALSPEEWDGIRRACQRALVETTNGVGSIRLQFDLPAELTEEQVQVWRELSAIPPSTPEGKERWATRGFSTRDGSSGSMIYFKWPRAVDGQSFLGTAGRGYETGRCRGSNLLDEARVLSAAARSWAKPSGDLDRAQILQLASSASMTLATLAAEMLTKQGVFTVPPQVFSLASRPGISGRTPDHAGTALFEDRIDVNSYNAFELVHPAYARQMVCLADFVVRNAPTDTVETLRCIDLGSGPGLPLIMLTEMVEGISVTAVEPSPVAFGHLARNVAHLPHIEPVQMDVLEMPPAAAEGVNVIISIGSSHHLDTAAFLSKAHSCLTRNGLLVVADEFLSPFANAEEREAELIKHHGTYILATQYSEDEIRTDPMIAPEEGEAARLIANELPIAVYEADNGRVIAASARCRRLFSALRSIDLPVTIRSPLTSFVRFHILEIEALVAGLDYEVERKTFPRRFIELAETCGFNLVEHQRVCGTVGPLPLDAGTHVFAFTKGR